MRNWTKKVDIFNMDYLVIPVNSNNHWNLLIVCKPSSLINRKEEIQCKIIGMDSMFEIKSVFYDAIRVYLKLKAS